MSGLAWHLWVNSSEYADPSLMTRRPRIAGERWTFVHDATGWAAVIPPCPARGRRGGHRVGAGGACRGVWRGLEGDAVQVEGPVVDAPGRARGVADDRVPSVQSAA
mgnify:CR=1 FL=1